MSARTTTAPPIAPVSRTRTAEHPDAEADRHKDIEPYSVSEQAAGIRWTLRQRVLPFTGLMPVLLMVPLLAFNLYAVAIALGIASGAAVIAYHARMGQGLASLDLALLGFALLNAVLYFGLGSSVLIAHIDAVIYTLLSVTAAVSLLGDAPWTAQFTKRAMPPAVWNRWEFREINRSSTALWAIGFAICDAIALAARRPLRLYAPIAAMIVLAMVSRRVARAHLARLLGVSVAELPPEWLAEHQASNPST